MAYHKKILVFAVALLSQICVFAQTVSLTGTDSNQGLMRSEGKVYVAMVVAITILAGLILFVWRLDRKISKLEKQENL